MNMLRSLLALSTLALGISTAHALPVVSVDVDPGTPGVQSALSITSGSGFTVDIVIEGVEPAAPLNGFEFDLFFDPGVLAATSIVEGDFLLDPVFVAPFPGTVIDNSTGLAAMAAVTLAPIGDFGDGVLASISFDTLALGASALDLENVLLSAPFGVPISFGGSQDGSVNIVPAAAAPEPLVPVLLGGGLLALAIQGRIRQRRRHVRR